MNFKKIIAAFSVFISVINFALFAQQDSLPLTSVVEKTQKLLTSYPIEKVHIHFDKPYYAVGDTLWFKTYLNSNMTNYQLSKIVYVEMLNGRDSVIRILQLPVKEKTANGQIVLDPETFKQDNYRFRAYTMWMANQGPDYFFNKVVPIGDVLRKQLYTHIDFKDVSANNVPATEARIVFKDFSGKPYVGKKVSWEVISNFESIAKGKGETAADGSLVAKISTDLKAKLTEGKLVTSVVLANPDKPAIGTFPLSDALNDLDLQFFPEGGELLGGVETNIAFKAVGSNGLSREVKGEVLDKDNKVVANFTSEHLGMGKFKLTPELGTIYRVNVTVPSGSNYSFRLPRVRQSGIGLHVDSSDSLAIKVAIVANDTYFERNKGKGFYLLAQSGGILCYAAQAILNNRSFNASIPKDKFPTGVAQFALLSSKGLPLSERLVFIRHDDTLKLQVQTDKKAYAIKDKVLLNLVSKSDSGATSGSFSVAVTDETKVPYAEDDENTILSNFLLTSDLKGYIEKPNYYFNHINSIKEAHLDLLMMTQGFRRFSYRDILADKYPQVLFFPQQGIDITGMVRLKNGMPAANVGLLISIPDKRYNAEARTDENGLFKFSNVVFTDSSSVTINARGNDNYRDLVITLDGEHYPGINKNPDRPDELQNMDTVLKSYLANSQKEYRSEFVLDEVEVVAKPVEKPSHKDYPALSGLSPIADHVIDGKQFSGCNDLLTCLQTQAMGLTYEDYNFYVTRDYNGGNRTPVQVFLNGMAVDVNALNTVMPAEVESVEIFTKDDLGTVNRTYQSNGVLVVNTKKKPKGQSISIKDLDKLIPKSNIITFSPLGYFKTKEFYSPKYTTIESKNISDLRSTIFWAPNVVTDKLGNAKLEFYNADGKGNYRVIVEGMAPSGQVGRTIYHYQVK
ncbi:hypothetical protein SAMN05216436_104238 [bacterium A37T11]|nr:hypothetical protein SAMN05216436_104238 [bacterium A37T11]